MRQALPRPSLFLALLLLPWLAVAQTQTYPGLVRQSNARLTVYCTPGYEARAAAMAARCAGAMDWLSSPAQFNFTPSVTLLVLGATDWPRYAAPGQPYGMPHTALPRTAAGKTLVVAATTNPVWENTLPPLASLPAAAAQALATTYRSARSSQLSLEKLFDLLALHELGHLYYRQAELARPRYWLEEFFASLVLHSYLATHEPAQLPALEVFPQVVVAGTNPTQLPYHTLVDFERHYTDMDSKTYGWYQCRLHRAVARVYNADPHALRQLWQALHKVQATYTDAELAAFLTTYVGPTLTQVQTEW